MAKKKSKQPSEPDAINWQAPYALAERFREHAAKAENQKSMWKVAVAAIQMYLEAPEDQRLLYRNLARLHADSEDGVAELLRRIEAAQQPEQAPAKKAAKASSKKTTSKKKGPKS